MFGGNFNEPREHAIAAKTLINYLFALIGLPADRPPLAVVIAGGGTGGHLFPGIAIAEAFQKRDARCRVLFIGTDRPFERNSLARCGFDHQAIDALGIKGVGIRRKLQALLALPVALWQAARHLNRFAPDVVVGVGGYSAGPVGLAARLRGVPVVLHEQNSIAGLTNRLLAPLARRIYLSFEQTRITANPSKTRTLGNPVRREVLEGEPAGGEAASGGASAILSVLIIGGSQGAHVINAAVVEMLTALDRPERFQFVHQTGAKDETWVAEAYRAAGVSAQVGAFFHDMGRRYHAADLLICRAGATTIAEITALGKAAIFVPFAAATDDHQAKNAAALVARGAARMVPEDELSGRVLAEMVTEAHARRDWLAAMARRAGRLGNRHAAADIVEDCCTLLERSAA